MSRGGFRPGSGRPKGSRSRTRPDLSDVPGGEAVVGMSPLQYMLAVMRDPEIGSVRRDRMAVAAAPFCHERMADNRIGKRAQAAADAEAASQGWGGDLDYDACPSLAELMARRGAN